ncbi:hypothetical protein C2845_PM01G28620 [Panicum miliaceum]|uniref:At1g61320/AtMIF1 LRR domain-containing protein n=1 Tax=Panicum miliaceum TaxID=4540 RepID=A0A3L6TS61_PANMI|nr:hypothetical protein C2845_PM01G28620 [Panicum miliaceum]
MRPCPQLEAQNGRLKEMERGEREDGRAQMPTSAPELAVAAAHQPAAAAAVGSCRRGGGLEAERINLPVKAFIFTHLRHLRLELVLYGNEKRETDVLDYAYLLEVAPFMEKLELLMWLCCQGRPYCKENGELRSRPQHHHTHLMSVRISGFFGHKDQVELSLHILRSSFMLEKMVINPRVEIAGCTESDKQCYERKQYVDGHRVATEFVCKADHRNVVDAVRASFSWGFPLDYCHARGVKGLSRPRGRLSRRHKVRRGRHP